MSRREKRLYSAPVTWAASSTLVFDLAFLEAAKVMSNPEIAELIVHFDGIGDTDADSTFDGQDFARIFDLLVLRDAKGDRVNRRGAVHRAALQGELGQTLVDPTQIAVNQSNTTFEVSLPLYPELIKAARPADYYIPLNELVEGGEFTVRTTDATPIDSAVTIDSGTFWLEARVVEGSKAEAKSRLCYLQQQINADEAFYDIHGRLRSMLVVAPEADGTAGYQSLTGTDRVDNEDLELFNLTRFRAVQEYYRKTINIDTTADEVANGSAWPIYTPGPHQKIGRLPRLTRTKIEFDTRNSVTNMFLAFSVIRPRSAQTAARTFGVTPSQLRTNIRNAGYIKGADGSHQEVSEFDTELAQDMPVRY